MNDWVFWYLLGSLVCAIWVELSMSVHRASRGTQFFVAITWPIVLVIVFIGVVVTVIKTIWKGTDE